MRVRDWKKLDLKNRPRGGIVKSLLVGLEDNDHGLQ